MSDLLEYDKSIVETLHHIEDVLVKFSLQSYASVGVVLLSYYTTDKMPRVIAPLLAIVLGCVFLWAIWFNLRRYTVIFRMHQIARNQWFQKEQKKLRDALYADVHCHKTLTTPVRFWEYN